MVTANTPNPTDEELRSVTVDISIPETEFEYDDADALVMGKAIGQALLTYSQYGGNLNNWTARPEPYELDSGTGIRIYIEGVTLG